MGVAKAHIKPLWFAEIDGGHVRMQMRLADVERLVSEVEPAAGHIRGAIDGSTITLRLSGMAHRFFTTKHSRTVTWYLGANDLPALARALDEAKAAAAQFGSPSC